MPIREQSHFCSLHTNADTICKGSKTVCFTMSGTTPCVWKPQKCVPTLPNPHCTCNRDNPLCAPQQPEDQGLRCCPQQEPAGCHERVPHAAAADSAPHQQRRRRPRTAFLHRRPSGSRLAALPEQATSSIFQQMCCRNRHQGATPWLCFHGFRLHGCPDPIM